MIVRLNRPEVANAMNTQMGLDLLAVFDGFCAEPISNDALSLLGVERKRFVPVAI